MTYPSSFTKPVVLPKSQPATSVQRERLLEAVDKFVPWAELVAIIAPHWPFKDSHPHLPEILLRISLMQQWFGLSDDEILQDIVNIPFMNAFSHIRHLDKFYDDIMRAKRVMRWQLSSERKLWEKITAIIDNALADNGALLKQDTETMEAVLVYSMEEALTKQQARLEAKAKSRFFVPLKYWSFQARLLAGMIIFQCTVMLISPQNVLTRFPLVGYFVKIMEWCCGLLPWIAQKNNTITYLRQVAKHPELAQLLASLMIAMLPLYIYVCYRWLGFDRKRNYRHFVISPYSREKMKGNTGFIMDGLSDGDQKKLGILTEALPGAQRSLVSIFIWSVLLFILPIGSSLMIFGFGQSEYTNVGNGGLLWMEQALLYVGDGGVVNALLAVVGIQAVAIFGAMVTAALFCCWRDWFLFVSEKLKGK